MKELFQEISPPPQPLEEIRDEPAERFYFSFRSLRLYEMRLIEHHDIPQMAKRDDSAQSSPVPTPSPPPRNIRLNTTRHLTTMFKRGEVAADDPDTNLVPQRREDEEDFSPLSDRLRFVFSSNMTGSKAGLTTVVVFNLAHR
jgi:hypothetical protein